MNVRRVILAAICALLFTEAAVAQQGSDARVLAYLQKRIHHAAGIKVSVKDGVATISGTVSNLARKNSILSTSTHTAGVKKVVDKISVVPRRKISDEEILKSVRKSFQGNLTKEEISALTISVQNGVISIKGISKSSYTKQLSESLASGVWGVTEVKNEIAVKPTKPRPDSEIEAEIKANFNKNPFISTQKIEVKAHDGVTVLTGVVNSDIAMEQAEAIVRFTEGVTDVQNHIFVSEEK